MKVKDFFGIDLKQSNFDIDFYIDLIGQRKEILKSETVKNLIKKHGSDHPIIAIAKRQALLRHLKFLINSELAPLDPYYYKKECNTSSATDRQYGAEEKLLEYCLVIATGITSPKLENSKFTPNIKILRDIGTKKLTRFDHYWQILNDHTSDRIKRFKSENKKITPTEKKGFFSNLFS